MSKKKITFIALRNQFLAMPSLVKPSIRPPIPLTSRSLTDRYSYLTSAGRRVFVRFGRSLVGVYEGPWEYFGRVGLSLVKGWEDLWEHFGRVALSLVKVWEIRYQVVFGLLARGLKGPWPYCRVCLISVDVCGRGLGNLWSPPFVISCLWYECWRSHVSFFRSCCIFPVAFGCLQSRCDLCTCTWL